jgi:AcrR family transcriptional regulator
MSSRERREELVEAAIRVMVREGVARATTRAIVAEAGMTLGVFHYCFTSRAELLQEVTTRLTDRSVAAVRESLASEGDLRSSIAGSLRAFWKGVEAAPREELLGYELGQYALRHEGFRELAEHQYAHYLEVHAGFLESAAEQAGIERVRDHRGRHVRRRGDARDAADRRWLALLQSSPYPLLPERASFVLYVNDLARCPGSVQEPADVGAITGHHVSPQSSRGLRDHGIYDVSRACASQQLPGRMGPLLGQAHDLAAA